MTVQGSQGRGQRDDSRNVWDTYVTDVRSRLKVGDERACIVIINTRWHVDDLWGRILPD